ncbi:MAG: MFS transporter, partial [Planctomycetota bacterium]|nr:MFS transporter [Planctomycetota bacterium]
MTMPNLSNPEFGRRHFAWIMFAAFLCYLPLIMPLSSLSIHVIRDWGMSNFLAGAAAGAAFLSTFLFRKSAGDLADRVGGKICFVRGSVLYIAGGLVALFSSWDVLPIPIAYALLVLGRLILGFGESLTNVGVGHWCIGRTGMARAGRVMATHGMCLYATVAFGGWIGFSLYEWIGFGSVLLICVVAPILGLAIALRSPEAAPPVPRDVIGKLGIFDVVGRIWRLSVPCGLHAVAFAVPGAFLSKTFLDRGWEYAGIAFTVTGVGFVCMRLAIGNLPDRWGGLSVARLSGSVAFLGACLLWLAPGPYPALLGAFFSGAGCSMVYPSIALEVVLLSPEAIRGVSMSANVIFIDIAYCFSG